MVEPQFQRVARYGGHQFQGVAVGEFVFGLALELRVEYTGGQHKGHAVKHIVALYFHTTRQQVVVIDEIAHRLKYRLAQARFVGTAQRGGNQIDIALAVARAFFQPG